MELTFLVTESLKDTFKFLKFSGPAIPQKPNDDALHLQRVIEWIDQSCVYGKGGSASHYSLLKGWLHPFPETTGYIIPTLFDYASFSKNKKYTEIAVKLTDWLCKVQLDNGACMQGNYDEAKGKTAPIIFNTGQNMLGFVRAYQETGNKKYLDSAVKAGNLLVASTDAKGVWDKNLHRNLKHTINVRCSWALLMLNEIVPNADYIRVAESNLNWAMQQQTASGWFHYGTSRIGGLPNTHFLSYTCEGFLESYRINKKKEYLKTAIITATKLREIFEERGMLYAFWDENWKNHGKYIKSAGGKFICMTGNIQISIVWMQLFEETGDKKFLDAAFKMLNYIKTLQDIDTPNTGIRGGIKGSFPVYGSYSALMYPNWAAKYFADAMLLKIKLANQK